MKKKMQAVIETLQSVSRDLYVFQIVPVTTYCNLCIAKENRKTYAHHLLKELVNKYLLIKRNNLNNTYYKKR